MLAVLNRLPQRGPGIGGVTGIVGIQCRVIGVAVMAKMGFARGAKGEHERENRHMADQFVDPMEL